MIPCFVGGKGMYASEATWEFKTAVMEFLLDSGLGIDVRFRYYQEKFPSKSAADLARLVCDPLEYFDPDWPIYWANKKDEGRSKEGVLTEFMLQLDARFRRSARVAIFGYDEAGFGTGVNTMRFVHEGKPVLGLYNPSIRKRDVNMSNILQLKLDYPFVVSIEQYSTPEELKAIITDWLASLAPYLAK